MDRRAFLLMASGLGLVSPLRGGLREAIDQQPTRRGSNGIARAICRGATASSANASAQIAQRRCRGRISRNMRTRFRHSREPVSPPPTSTCRLSSFSSKSSRQPCTARCRLRLMQEPFVGATRLATRQSISRVSQSRRGAARRPRSPTTTICRRHPFCRSILRSTRRCIGQIR